MFKVRNIVKITQQRVTTKEINRDRKWKEEKAYVKMISWNCVNFRLGRWLWQRKIRRFTQTDYVSYQTSFWSCRYLSKFLEIGNFSRFYWRVHYLSIQNWKNRCFQMFPWQMKVEQESSLIGKNGETWELKKKLKVVWKSFKNKFF